MPPKKADASQPPQKRTDRHWVGQHIVDGKKECTACHRWLGLEEFSRDPRVSSGRTSECKMCTKLSHWYQITFEEYQAIAEAQHHLCAICHKPQSRKGRVKWLAVDHNHETGEIRGLLCQACNTGLGAFKDSYEKARRAVEYLHTAGTGIYVRSDRLWVTKQRQHLQRQRNAS